jgi:activator of 2-hydroxyglutaryl-CoA dehydratase
MNDKCAAGTGRGMEIFADLLSVPIEEVGATSLKVDEEPGPVSSTCVVFAKSEAVSLLRRGWPTEKVLAAYVLAMSMRMFELIDKVGYAKDFVITGGQSKNIGTVTRLEKLMGIKRLPPPDWKAGGLDAMTAGAIGGALFAKALYDRAHPSK